MRLGRPVELAQRAAGGDRRGGRRPHRHRRPGDVVTLGATMAANTVGLEIAPLAPTLATEERRGAALLRARRSSSRRPTRADGARHSTTRPTCRSCGADEEIFQVARGVPGGSGRRCRRRPPALRDRSRGGGIPIISSYSRGVAFGRIDLAVDRADPAGRQPSDASAARSLRGPGPGRAGRARRSRAPRRCRRSDERPAGTAPAPEIDPPARARGRAREA